MESHVPTADLRIRELEERQWPNAREPTRANGSEELEIDKLFRAW